MTKMVYTVINRPKKDETGRTDIGWKEDGASEEVPFAGFLITSRTTKGEVRTYTATVVQSPDADFPEFKIKTHLGDDFKTRAQAAFAIWRAFYMDVKIERQRDREAELRERGQRQKYREARKTFRATPCGEKAYREALNAKARARRAAMTPEQKDAIARRRREKRKLEKSI